MRALMLGGMGCGRELLPILRQLRTMPQGTVLADEVGRARYRRALREARMAMLRRQILGGDVA